MHTHTPREILTDLWLRAGGAPAELAAAKLTGEEPLLPSSFRVAAAAQASIAASGLAAADIWRARSGEGQEVAVDMCHAVVECRSERYLRLEGINTAQGNAKVLVELYRVAFDPLKEISFISDEYNKFELEGSLLADTTKPYDAVLGQFGRIVQL